MKVPWQAPLFLTAGLVLAFPYFITNPPGLNDGSPPLIGILTAASFFVSGYYAGKRRRREAPPLRTFFTPDGVQHWTSSNIKISEFDPGNPTS